MTNCFCSGPDHTGKCACQRGWRYASMASKRVKELEIQHEVTTESLSIHKALYVEALKQKIKLEEKLKKDRLYWYNQGWFDAVMEMNEEKNDERKTKEL